MTLNKYDCHTAYVSHTTNNYNYYNDTTWKGDHLRSAELKMAMKSMIKQ